MYVLDTTGTSLYQVTSATYNASTDFEVFMAEGFDRSPKMSTSGDTDVPRFVRSYSHLPAIPIHHALAKDRAWNFDLNGIDPGDVWVKGAVFTVEEWVVPY